MYQSHTDPLCFRSLAESDLPALYELLSLAETSEKLHWSPTFGDLEDAYQRFWKNDPDERHYLLTRSNQLAGWLKLNGFCGHSLWISMLVIAPEYWGQHFGLATLDFTETTARQLGFHTLGVQTTVDNLTAIALYLKHGFRLIHYIPSEQRYVLKKTL